MQTKEYKQEYYKKNKEMFFRKAIKWKEENKERFLTYQREYRRTHPVDPLYKLLNNINQRCNYPKDKKYKYYGGKGIKNFLTLEDLKYLWNRDRAGLMKQPSIDRKNGNGNYTIENCQFIEMEANRKKRVKHYKQRRRQ